MALNRRIQHIRGTTAQNNVFTGRSGELTIDTDTNEVRVHDGSTVGGHRLYTKAEVDTLLSSKVTQTDIDTSIATLLSAIYPVGSVYIGTQSTCPLTTIIPGSVWTLVATKIVVDNPNNIPVIGNGKTLGVTINGSTVSTLKCRDNDGTVQYLDYNATLGSVQSNRGITTGATNAYALGLTTDPTKSGIIADMSSVTTITTNVWRRTA